MAGIKTSVFQPGPEICPDMIIVAGNPSRLYRSFRYKTGTIRDAQNTYINLLFN